MSIPFRPTYYFHLAPPGGRECYFDLAPREGAGISWPLLLVRRLVSCLRSARSVGECALGVELGGVAVAEGVAFAGGVVAARWVSSRASVSAWRARPPRAQHQALRRVLMHGVCADLGLPHQRADLKGDGGVRWQRISAVVC